MAKDFEIKNEMNSDKVNGGNNTCSDYGGELAKGDGVDLNKAVDAGKSTNGKTIANASIAKEMDEELNAIREIEDINNSLRQPESANYCEAPKDPSKPLSQQIQDMHPDLTIKNCNSKDEFSKAMEYAPPSPEYTSFAELPRESAIYCDAPAHVGRSPDDIIRQINEGMGPGPENDVEQPLKPESAGHCDPPEDMEVADSDISD